MASITFAHVGKVYADKTRAVEDLNLEIADGEFMVMVGPSGCGKTTALRMVAGLEEISEGEIRIGERVVNRLDPGQRDVAMVFQNYALYPHMSVFDNIAFPLRSRRLPHDEVRGRVERTAQALGLMDYLKKKPRTLSGGQRQRVAMGRAIVREPQAFLMDEPLSNLDAKLRVQMRQEISRLQRELNATTIYVTHDQVEAMTMGTRIAVMRKGVLQQEGVPQELYDRPANLFVASFIGSPAMNLVRARIERNGAALRCRLREQMLDLPHFAPRCAEFVGRDVAVGIRPEHLFVDRADLPQISVEVALTETLGPEHLLHLSLAADPVVTEDVLEVARDIDDTALAELESEAFGHRVNLVTRIDPTHRFAVGQRLDISVAAAKVHLFDLENGEVIQ